MTEDSFSCLASVSLIQTFLSSRSVSRWTCEINLKDLRKVPSGVQSCLTPTKHWTCARLCCRTLYINAQNKFAGDTWRVRSICPHARWAQGASHRCLTNALSGPLLYHAGPPRPLRAAGVSASVNRRLSGWVTGWRWQIIQRNWKCEIFKGHFLTQQMPGYLSISCCSHGPPHC